MTTAYAQRALDAEVQDVAGAANGGRNDRLNRAAYALAGLVAINQLDENTVRDRLTRAGRDAGLGPREVKKAIKSGMRAGLRNPRTIPARGVTSTSSPSPSVIVQPCYPPPVEVRALWERCGPVDLDEYASAWLRSRGLDPARIVDADCARALPASGTLPPWATCCGRSWSSAYRVVLGLFDAAGELCSLHARRTFDVDDTLPKGASPADFNVRGLGMADAGGRRLLHGAGARDVVIVEGAPNFLAWASAYSDADEAAPAVLGILSGSWTEEHAARIPDGARIVVDVDHDDAGQKYAETIRTTFKGRRVDLLRAKARTA